MAYLISNTYFIHHGIYAKGRFPSIYWNKEDETRVVIERVNLGVAQCDRVGWSIHAYPCSAAAFELLAKLEHGVVTPLRDLREPDLTCVSTILGIRAELFQPLPISDR